MEIKGVVHCFFEQSGTFKNEFKKLGYEAFDYDIQNNFNETDFEIDLFAEIEKAYENKESIFDKITSDDLIIAFFPCIYFCEANVRLFRFEDSTHIKHSRERAIEDMLNRSKRRQLFFEFILKFFLACEKKRIRLILENPYSVNSYLYQYFPYRAKYIDMDRSRRGDRFKKPTQYFFLNCEPAELFTLQKNKAIPVNSIDDRCKNKNYKKLKKEGIDVCSEEKSTMTIDYARNFICDQILGISQQGIKNQQFVLF